jgi:hypothetical protein
MILGVNLGYHSKKFYPLIKISIEIEIEIEIEISLLTKSGPQEGIYK